MRRSAPRGRAVNYLGPSPFPSVQGPEWSAPDDAACLELWEAFGVPEHIRRHCFWVAEVATAVASAALEAGLSPAEVPLASVRASAMLHDLAKDYTIRFGGNHSQIGAAWVLEITGNPLIAQGVIHHVCWPFDLDVRRHFLPLAVMYGDKRVRHDALVKVDERFEDLFKRYGRNAHVIELIRRNMDQTREVERRLSALLGVDLDACTVDSGRLVVGA